MTPADALDWISQLLYSAVLVGAPPVLTVVVVGLVVSIAQAATQVNDAAVAFAPKLIAAVICLVLAGEWMLLQLREFASDAISAIAVVGPGS